MDGAELENGIDVAHRWHHIMGLYALGEEAIWEDRQSYASDEKDGF